ncbi:MAG TPA: cytidylate kinase family protein [Candidatus Binatia bacterium]|nr:cytidylate kinase family protein [Candidatus Binatia bacterium]
MAIITIYQGASGSGEELAEGVAESLGCGCISREVLVEASLRYGIPEAKLNRIVEREANWWQRFVENLEPYRIALQAAFCEIAETAGQNGLVYHGHIGHELLPGFKHVLKVLLTAPMEMRIEQVRARNALSENAARRYIEEVDRARSRRLLAMFGVDWRDPSRFDLAVNLGCMSLAAAKRLICETVHLPDYQATAASKQAFEDFALASRVRAVLALSSDLPKSKLDIQASGGIVTISGAIPAWLSEETLLAKVRAVRGVQRVVSDIVQVPDMGVAEWP